MDFYSNLFTSSFPNAADIQKITNLLPPSNTDLFTIHLSALFSPDEVRRVLFDLNPSKTPSPDGYTVLFFQNAWDIIGTKITNAILGFLYNEDSLKDCNSTVVTLIPKVKNPSYLKDFRPISLCNVKY